MPQRTLQVMAHSRDMAFQQRRRAARVHRGPNSWWDGEGEEEEEEEAVEVDFFACVDSDCRCRRLKLILGWRDTKRETNKSTSTAASTATGSSYAWIYCVDVYLCAATGELAAGVTVVCFSSASWWALNGLLHALLGEQ